MQTVSEHQYFTLQIFLENAIYFFMLLRVKDAINQKKRGSKSPTKYHCSQ